MFPLPVKPELLRIMNVSIKVLNVGNNSYIPTTAIIQIKAYTQYFLFLNKNNIYKINVQKIAVLENVNNKLMLIKQNIKIKIFFEIFL